MPLSRQDVFLGRALIAWGLVDRGRLEACAAEVDRLQAQGRPVTLGQVLVERGVLSVARYQTIVARLRQVYLAASSPGTSQVQQATAQLPYMSDSGRYTPHTEAPRAVDESSVDRAVAGWQRVGPQVAAGAVDFEFDFSPAASPSPTASRPAPPPPGRDTGRHAVAAGAGQAGGAGPAPAAPAGGGTARTAHGRAGPDAAIRRRLKVPPDQDQFQVGAWTVERYLAEGAWGIVYQVKRAGDDRPFAMKILKHLEPSPQVRQRFVLEAKTMAKLEHPGIVHVHDVGTAEGLVWFVMDFQPGKSLKDQLEEDGPMPLAEGLRVVVQLCDAVAYAHGQGIFHRDLKPENVIMAGGRDPVLTDFGLAKDAQSGLNLTTEGQRIGTPLYMAPEMLLEAEAATPQSEVYALGAITYQVLAGEVPYFAKSMADLASLIQKGKLTPLRQRCAAASKALEKTVEKALHKDPAKRHPTVAALRDELRAAT